MAQSFVLAAFATLVCQRNCVFLCKGTKLQKAVLFAIVRRSFMEGSCIGFWKSKANSTFCKVVKQKGEACFCRLCNQVLPKTLRFSLQRQKAPEFGIRRILGQYAGFLFYQRLVPKPENSAKPNSRTVCRFPPWYAFLPLIPAVWGFGLGLLGGQGFIGAKASLDPLCRALWHRALLWQPLQPWFVKETAFFFAKAQNLRIRRSRILGLFAGFRLGMFFRQ